MNRGLEEIGGCIRKVGWRVEGDLDRCGRLTTHLYWTNAGLGEPWEVSIGASVGMKRPLLFSLAGLPAGKLPR
jgi:hypothetical protein